MPSAPRASRALRVAVLLALVALALAGAANHQLWTYDEPREAELARAMWRSGNYAYTVLGERPFLEKPPLFSASIALAFQLVGEASAEVARLVAALWAAVSLATVWWLARREIGERAGLVAVLVLATSGRFFTIGHTILLDNALCAFTTLALATGWVAARERRPGLAAVMGLALGGAFLTKGLVGVGVVSAVLGVDILWRRDWAGLRTLVHPVPIACAVVPVLAYTALLARAGGEHGGEFLREMLWNNQMGRFVSGYATRNERWYVYWKSWPEMLAPWSPVALLALGSILQTETAEPQSAQRDRRGRLAGVSSSSDSQTPFLDVQPPSPQDALCVPSADSAALRFKSAGCSSPGFPLFCAIWAVLPLVLLTCSTAKARNYALPVLPAYALLIASWWHSRMLDRELPTWGKSLFRVFSQLGPLAVLGAAAAAALHDMAELGGIEPPGQLFLDRTTLLAAALALVAGVRLVLANRGGRAASRESGALLLGLVVVAGFMGSTSTYFAKKGDLSRSYEGLAGDVWKQAGSRRLLLYHANDSWSGTFAWVAGRSTPEFNELWDPDGEHFLAAIGPATSDVALAPLGSLRLLDVSRRSQLAIEWRGCREDERDDTGRQFVLVHRRAPDEAPHDPLAPERGP